MNFAANLLIHHRTDSQLANFLKKPVHALLITGVPGSGKACLARAAAASLLSLENLDGLANYPYFNHLQIPDGKQDIPIETVRQLIKNLRLKTTGTGTVRRVVLIENAQALSIEAQNALLKVLEEPSLDTVFLLTVSSAQDIAPTIVSRTRQLSVHPITLDSAKKHYAGQYPLDQIESNWRLSGGAVGLLEALLKNSTDHPLKNSVEEFKRLLKMTLYERILSLDNLAKDKLQLYLFLDAASRVLAALGQNTASKHFKNVLFSRKLVNRLSKALRANANPRLVALELALNLKL